MANITIQESLILLIVSSILAIFAIFLVVCGIIKSYLYNKGHLPSEDSRYFNVTALMSNIFNCGSCICVMIYFIWITLCPLESDLLFVLHKSIRMRVATTVAWYIGKIFLFLIFNGRLYYPFRNSIYRISRNIFVLLNIFVTIHAIFSLIIGYIGVLEIRNELVANIGFNSFHVICACLLIYLSVQFNKRMFRLSVSRIEMELSQSKFSIECAVKTSPTTSEKTPTDDRFNTEIPTDTNDVSSDTNPYYLNKQFIRVVSRTSILITWIIPFMISVTLTWTLHRFVFDLTHFSMCSALIVMSLDSLIDIICVLLLFKSFDPIYNGLCKCVYTNKDCKCGCDYICLSCCRMLAIRTIKM